MPRTHSSVSSRVRRRRILREAKGFFGRRKNVWSVAKNAVEKRWSYAYEGRKQRKRQMRSLWIQRINAGAREEGLHYALLMHKLKEQKVQLNRKALADLVMHEPLAFKQLVKTLK